MKLALSIALAATGLAVLVVGWRLLPPDVPRLEYAIEVVDPRPLDQSAMSDKLAALGAVRAVAVETPRGGAGAQRVLIVPRLSELLISADAELGRVPPDSTARGSERREPLKAAAGAATGLDMGPVQIGDVALETVVLLHALGPVFDSSLLVSGAGGAEEMLVSSASSASARYLLLAEGWKAHRRLLASISADPDVLPGPGAQVIFHERLPAISDPVRLTIGIALACVGLLIMITQLRGLTREEVTRRFGRA